ncbi:MAG: HEPN domain-containing protein [candidate division WOR-3 bacterium]
MNKEFQNCLDDGKLKPFKATDKMIRKELDAAAYDLERARQSLKAGDAKWATIQGYYAMFHCARALIFRKGYREKSHRCLLIALQELLVNKREMPSKHLDNLRTAMDLREDADYGYIYAKESAQDILDNATSFYNFALKFLNV